MRHWLANLISGGQLERLDAELTLERNFRAGQVEGLREAQRRLEVVKEERNEALATAQCVDEARLEAVKERDQLKRALAETRETLAREEATLRETNASAMEWRRKCEGAEQQANDNLHAFWTQKIKYNTANHYIRAVSGRVTAWIERWQKEQRRSDGLLYTGRILDEHLDRLRAHLCEYQEKEAKRRDAQQRARDPKTGHFLKSRKNPKV